MIINATYIRAMRRLLPIHRRQTNRLKVLDFVMEEFDFIFNRYRNYRAELLYRLNVSGETGSLEAHLNKVVPGADGSIQILHERDIGVKVQLRTEGGNNTVRVGLRSANVGVKIALRGEQVAQFDTSFVVKIPAAADSNKVTQIVNQYRLAGKSFKVIN